MENFEIAFWIVLIVAIILVIYAFHVSKERDKCLLAYSPLKRKFDNLQEEYDKYKTQNQISSTDKNVSKDGAATKKSDSTEAKDEQSVALGDKIKALKAEISKLKEDNFNVKKDNKALRQELKSNLQNNDSGQRELVDLRALNADLSSELSAAQAQIKNLEKQLLEQSESSVEVKNEQNVETTEQIVLLKKENSALQASIKDVKGELSAYKRDFKSQLDAAKKELFDANQPIKKDLARANRLCEQAKKRASNNHKIYLIARAQLILAEKKLAALDPNYIPNPALPVSYEAIDELVKKIDTLGARENKASEDLAEQKKEIEQLKKEIECLEKENETLKATQTAAKDISFGSLEDSFSDDSLSSIIGSVNEQAKAQNAIVDDVKLPESQSLVDLDFGDMDDDWA